MAKSNQRTILREELLQALHDKKHGIVVGGAPQISEYDATLPKHPLYILNFLGVNLDEPLESSYFFFSESRYETQQTHRRERSVTTDERRYAWFQEGGQLKIRTEGVFGRLRGFTFGEKAGERKMTLRVGANLHAYTFRMLEYVLAEDQQREDESRRLKMVPVAFMSVYELKPTELKPDIETLGERPEAPPPKRSRSFDESKPEGPDFGSELASNRPDNTVGMIGQSEPRPAENGSVALSSITETPTTDQSVRAASPSNGSLTAANGTLAAAEHKCSTFTSVDSMAVSQFGNCDRNWDWDGLQKWDSIWHDLRELLPLSALQSELVTTFGVPGDPTGDQALVVFGEFGGFVTKSQPHEDLDSHDQLPPAVPQSGYTIESNIHVQSQSRDLRKPLPAQMVHCMVAVDSEDDALDDQQYSIQDAPVWGLATQSGDFEQRLVQEGSRLGEDPMQRSKDEQKLQDTDERDYYATYLIDIPANSIRYDCGWEYPLNFNV